MGMQVRAALLTASQVATYDSVKREIIRAGGGSDSVWTHVAASGVTGLVTTTVTNPVDVVKTHMFVSGTWGWTWQTCNSRQSCGTVGALCAGWRLPGSRQALPIYAFRASHTGIGVTTDTVCVWPALQVLAPAKASCRQLWPSCTMTASSAS